MNYARLEESPYEKDFTEGLEQMRFLYNGLKVKLTLSHSFKGLESAAGVDSPEDVRRYEGYAIKFGSTGNCVDKP
jgi:3-deoxy-manno-octulosonate cytidylyltransferase (CMP-KDO synthetase)